VNPERVRAVRSAGYGQGRLQDSAKQPYRPRAPYHSGTPGNMQRPEFNNWSAMGRSVDGTFGTKSAVVYWADYKDRDERARGMRVAYELNDFRLGLVKEAFNKLDQDGDGVITIEDFRRGGYDFRTHPGWNANGAVNKWTEEQIYRQLLSKFKGGDQTYEPRAGLTERFDRLVPADFERYYERVGADIDDEYFQAMIVQAWRLEGHESAQGRDPEVLERLALIEANNMGDNFPGQEALDQQKLDAVAVSDADAEQLARWARMVRSGEFGDMHRAGRELLAWVGVAELVPGFEYKLPANAVRLMRKGGADILAQLAAAQDPEIKRAAADALISALAPRLARLALAHDPAGRTRLLREGVPSLCQASEPVTRNKGEKVRAMLAA
jgi:hypothetical protein